MIISNMFKITRIINFKKILLTVRGWQWMTVWVAKDGGSGEGLTCKEWRHNKGTVPLNSHCLSLKGYIGGQKFLAVQQRSHQQQH